VWNQLTMIHGLAGKVTSIWRLMIGGQNRLMKDKK
jgi:hypothetical protein